MRVERDIAGLAIPYASGTLIAAYTGNTLWSSDIPCSSAALAVTSILLLSLLHPARRRFQAHLTRLMTVALGMAAGLFAGYVSSSCSLTDLPGRLSIAASGFGESMQSAIDRIPFKDSQTNAVIKALVTGERGGLDHDIIKAFRDSGASHILALSGFHLGIIYTIIRHLLSILGNSRKAKCTKAVATVAICGFYTLATGAGASIVRAFIYIILHETARISLRCHSGGIVFMAALIIQLGISPESAGSAGFQLSYAAMAGITFIYPWLKDFWPDNGEIGEETRKSPDVIRRIWNSAALSISCQITTGPIAYLYFKSFPVNFLLTNLLALPVTGIVIPVSLLTLVLYSIGICPGILIHLTESMTGLLIRILEIIASM